MTWAQENGYDTFNIGMAPLAGLRTDGTGRALFVNDGAAESSATRACASEAVHQVAPWRCSRAAPTAYRRSSAVAGARIWKPAGSPSSSARPLGTEMPGTPARLAGIVATSLRYIASGSSSLAPSLNAVVGAVGLTSTSACSNAASKSRLISVRTFCAWP